MSRSRRRFPVHSMTTAESEKYWKRLNNRRLRRAVRVALLKSKEILPEMRDVSNTYVAPKDGKMLFDPDRHPNLMRK